MSGANGGTHPSSRPPWRGRRGLLFPAVLIVIGLVLLLRNLGVIEGDVGRLLLRLWPLLLVAIGLDSLVRRRAILGPTVLIGLGAIFLLSGFGLLEWTVWEVLTRCWPVLIIAVGLDLIVGRRSLLWALLALLLLAAMLAVGLWLDTGRRPESTHLVEWAPEAPVNRLAAELRSSLGSLQVDGGVNGPALARGTLSLSRGERLREERNVVDGVARLELGTRGPSFAGLFGRGEAQAGWHLSLSPGVPTELAAKLGVGQLGLDLTGLRLEEVQADLGIGQMRISLPEGRYRATIRDGIGQVTVVLPPGAAVRMVAHTGLTTVRVPPGYLARGDEYTSPEYASSETRIELEIHQGIGSLVVQ